MDNSKEDGLPFCFRHSISAFERNISILVTDTSKQLHEWETLEKVRSGPFFLDRDAAATIAGRVIPDPHPPPLLFYCNL